MLNFLPVTKRMSNCDSECNFAECIQAVKGLPSSSASPSDTWILGFKDGKKGFMKLWVSPHSTSPESANYQAREGLEYEVKIYRDLVKPLITEKISPNFILYIKDGEKCSQTDIASILKGGRSGLSDTQAEYNFNIALQYLMTKDKKNKRPSTTELTNIPPQPPTIVNPNWKISYVVTQAVPQGSLALEDWLLKDPSYYDFWVAMFQSVSAIYAMQQVEMTHNDLHTANLWVEPIGKSTNTLYAYGNGCYSFNTNFLVKVFDFDRSYSKKLGDNSRLHRLCEPYAQCNLFSPKSDLLRLFCGTYYILETKGRIELAKMIADILGPGINGLYKSEDVVKIFTFDKEGLRCQAVTSIEGKTPKSMSQEEISRFPSVEYVLKTIGKIIDRPQLTVDADNVYVCNYVR